MNIQVKVEGLSELRRNFAEAPDQLQRVINKALFDSIAMVETESKRRTPVRTGLLRSSIGGEQGYSFVRGLTAGVGTNVKYAIYVHEGYGKHVIGERKFMEKGVESAKGYIQQRFGEALQDLAQFLAQQ